MGQPSITLTWMLLLTMQNNKLAVCGLIEV